MKKAFYYNGERVVAQDCLLNFVLGARGIGKTYWYKRNALRKYIDNGEQFIYLRRTDRETARVKSRLLSDILEPWFSGDFRVDGYSIYLKNRETDKYDDECGFVIPLSLSHQFKSVPFGLVTTVIFDEFEVGNEGRYLSNEVERFLDFLSTVVRSRDNVRVYFLGNSLSIYNPYFLYFNVNLEENQKFYCRNEICVERWENKGFKTESYNTKFGALIKDTSYGNYNIENEYYLDNKFNIERKPGTSRFIANLIVNDIQYGMWYDYVGDNYYISKHIQEGLMYSFNSRLEDVNIYELKYLRYLSCFRDLMNHYVIRKVKFENQECKQAFKIVANLLRAKL